MDCGYLADTINLMPIMITRREALKTTALFASAAALAPRVLAHGDGRPLFSLTAMPYPYDALEPHLDAQTMEIHHRRHHKTYVDTLNAAVESLPAPHPENLEQLLRNLSALPEKVRTTVRNHGGGHYNHDLFWRSMKAAPGGMPTGELAKAMDRDFGSFTAFQDAFTKAALGRFGSGWA
ncbi:MAG: superoxide dismutase, partial [Bellilinea sp.]